MLRIFNSILLMLTCAVGAFAFNIRGKILDETGEPLPQATVRLLAASDSAFISGTMTNSSGAFTLSSVKKGNYLIEASYIGYDKVFHKTDIKNADITLDPIRMAESSVVLGNVNVIGVKTQIKVMEDTVEYNADSYKTAPNAVVEDLLKRLPGVEVGSDGKITANGKEVTKILVDGKEFFSDDPAVASKNLPVDMVDKLQVVDRKSDLARLTGVDDGEDETVINLTVKKGMKNGWFGNAEVGYGTDDRYKATFNVNRFTNGNQVTLLGNFNNINELGFSDGNSQRFRRFGGDNGITTSQALGLNFNVGNEEIFRVGGDVMWSRSDRDTRQQQERQYLFNDSSSYSSIGKYTRDRGQNIRADFRVQWKPDSFNTLDFRPNISWNHNHSTSLDSTFVTAGDALRSAVSRSFNTGDSRGNALEFGARLIYTHNFRNRRGRSFSTMVNYSHSNTHEWEDSYSNNMFYLFNDSVDVYDQFNNNHTWNNNVRARLSWTEPIGNPSKGNYLVFAYTINSRWNDADKLVFNRANPASVLAAPALPGFLSTLSMLESDPMRAYALAATSEDFELDPDLSNRFRNDYLSQELRAGYKHVSKTTNLEAGFSAIPTMSKSRNLINDAKNIPERWVWNYAPFLRYRYKMSKTRSLNMNYNGRSSQPSMTQLQPVADMSNPMHIVVGNPNLDPSFSHNMRIRYQDFNSENQRSIMLMANFSLTQNAIISSTEFNRETGGQTTTYRNVNGVWSGRIMNMISMPFRDKRWQFSNHFFTMFNRNIGFNNGQRNASSSLRVSEMPSLSFRPDNVEIELRPRYSLQYTANSVGATGVRTVHSYGSTLSLYYYTPIGVILNSDLEYSGTSGYAAGYDRNQWLWNASISYQFLRDKSATVAVKAYDLLQQRSSISRSVTANYIDDISYNSLTRYFMVTFSYRFNSFGGNKRPESNNFMNEGPGGMRGPGGMGGHPGGMGRPH